MICPECGHSQKNTVKCGKCGLYFPEYQNDEGADILSTGSISFENKKSVKLIVMIVLLVFVLVGLFLTRSENDSEKMAGIRPAEQDRNHDEAIEQEEDPDSIRYMLSKDNPPRNVIEKARIATVLITMPSSTGSGFFINSHCDIITNRHVVDNSGFDLEAGSDQSWFDDDYGLGSYDPRFDGKVILSNEEEFQIVHYEYSDKHDLALLRIQATDCPFIAKDKTPKLPHGSKVYAIGNPRIYRYVVTSGIVSGYTKIGEVEYIQTDAPINPGNSGGPLINEKGHVIGINTLKSSIAEGIGFAIPISRVYEDFSSLKKINKRAFY